MKSAAFVASLAIVAQGVATLAAPVRDGHVQAELISESSSISPGQPFLVGVHLQMDSGWHVNWRNPGDAGLPPSIAWTLPPGSQAGEIQWPSPESINQGPLAIFGYENAVLLMVQVTPPADLSDRVSLAARVDWVACGDVCMPGGVNLNLELPVSRDPASPDSRWAEEFAEARSSLPVEQSGAAVKADLRAETIVLTLATPESWSDDPGGLRFFPYTNGLIENAAPQKLERYERSFALSVSRAHNNTKAPDRIAGIVVSSKGWRGPGTKRAMAFDVSVSADSKPVDSHENRTSNGR